MPIKRPDIPAAESGAPITAEAWNTMRAAILQLYDLLDAKPTTGSIKVTVSGKSGEAVPAIAVFAVRKDDATRRYEAKLEGDTFVLADLPEATYLVTASGQGYVSETTAVIVTAGDTESRELKLAKQEATVAMPTVKGESLSKAVATLMGKGLTAMQVTDEFGKVVNLQALGIYEAAQVMDQSPAFGQVVPVSTKVELRVQAMRQMPAVKGDTLTQALKEILENNLQVSALTVENSGTLNKDQVPPHYYGAEVLEQSPPAGAVPASAPVSLHLRAMRVMPDLAGKMVLEQAVEAVKKAELTLGSIAVEGGGSFPPNAIPAHYKGATVLTQTPGPGPVRADTPVTIQVKAMLVMPEVAHKMGLKAALAALAGLKLQSVKDTEEKAIDPANLPAQYVNAVVVQQTPGPGPVAAGTAVTLRVQAMRIMPQIAGSLTLDAGLKALGDLPVEWIRDTNGATLDRNALMPEYIPAPVETQAPAAGPVVAGTKVRLIVVAMRNLENLVGKPLNQALAILGAMAPDVIQDTRNASINRAQIPAHYTAALVTWQGAGPGPIRADQKVALRVNAMVPVPESRNKYLVDAKKAIPAGLALGQIKNDRGETFTPDTLPAGHWNGTVTHQEPLPGAAVWGSSITLHQAMVQVPSLSTVWTTASGQLAAVGLRGDVVRDGEDTGEGHWIFNGYSPAAGTWVPRGSVVVYKFRYKVINKKINPKLIDKLDDQF